MSSEKCPECGSELVFVGRRKVVKRCKNPACDYKIGKLLNFGIEFEDLKGTEEMQEKIT